jgi:phosphatidate phosphatase LPIN
VIRKIGADGEVTLSSSPFHVRFGKLQVLRAGEKRVTLRLPNNLPAPHIAPFSMKVGETGEAFFVLETTDDVPEDLMTSPVVMPTEVSRELYRKLICRTTSPRRHRILTR